MSSRTDDADAILPAPLDAVFAAFCDGSKVASWMPPSGMRAEIARWEVMPGADYAMTLFYTDADHPDGKAGGGRDVVEGRFVSVTPPNLVVQEARFPSDDLANAGTMRLTWQFEAAGEQTRASVSASDVPTSIDPAVHRKALHDTLRQLGEVAADG